MITSITIYLFIGVLYSLLLETYTTNNLEGALGKPWSIREKIYHLLLWPLSMSIFIYTFIDELFKNR